MRIIMIYALLSLLGINFQYCGGQANNNKKNKEMANGYSWGPAASAPKLFPVESRYVIFYVGVDNSPYPVIYSELRRGIANGSSNAALNDFDAQMAMPNGFKTIWLSRAERKVYGGDFTFTDAQKERYRRLFVQGYEVFKKWQGKTEQKHYTYTTFCVTFIPGGKALLHITGPGRRVYVDSFQCDELKDITLEELNFPYVTNYKTMKEHFDRTLKYEEYQPMLAYIKEHGIPYKLWDRYLEKFNYKIKIKFENNETKLDPDYGSSYANGEIIKSRDGIPINSLARIKSLAFKWYVGDVKYTGHFYFNEDEVLEFFDKAYGKDRGQNGEFVIYVSKNNNRFDIFLRVGDRELKFEKTQIHVFKQGVEQPDKEAIVFYNNHRDIHSSNIKFIGE
ncbi:DUF2931 family protein [Coprobacter tertius]|uniref:DUF2931 family protein n=1 Tax=Coprobacter tertius TaxID=2944915 RepID=A0ABT1MDW7_9BACT|nr:DUF2931 family protein [Coprobacter tertius]MCP9610561.1 DUF2931 family protein [Coprobacter tertius]